MQSGTTTRRIELRDAILNHPDVTRVQGAYMMRGDFPGGVIHKKIDLDPEGRPFIHLNQNDRVPRFLTQFLCRGEVLAA